MCPFRRQELQSQDNGTGQRRPGCLNLYGPRKSNSVVRQTVVYVAAIKRNSFGYNNKKTGNYLFGDNLNFPVHPELNFLGLLIIALGLEYFQCNMD